MRRRAFSLLELLVVVGVVTLLLAMLVPGLALARTRARATACASNLRQIALANVEYACEQAGRCCPAAARIMTENLRRWHGTRTAKDQAFDPQRGPLVPYLTSDARIRACAELREFVAGDGAFEAGCGGYGYNQAYVGRVIERQSSGNVRVVTDESGTSADAIRRPADTLMFADAALAAVANGVIEYSFAEPRFHPQYVQWKARMDPSLQFRHAQRANVAWCDGHVEAEVRTFTWASGVYPGDPEPVGLGWFGPDDDNGYFDLE